MKIEETTAFEAVGARLKRLRDYTGLSQAEFAKRAGVARTAYNNVETGVQGISRKMLISLCVTYGVTADFLLFGETHALPSHMADALSSSDNERSSKQSSDSPN